MNTRPTQILVPAILAILTCAGCHKLLYPHDKPNVLYGGVPFRFGTNAPVEMHARLRASGGYHLYFLLRKDSLPRDAKGRVPVWLDTPVHALVVTNGQTAFDKEVNRLYLINVNTQVANYSLALFHGEKDSDALCRIQDRSGGILQAEGTINLQQIRHH